MKATRPSFNRPTRGISSKRLPSCNYLQSIGYDVKRGATASVLENTIDIGVSRLLATIFMNFLSDF
jgi:hypothetical protein